MLRTAKQNAVLHRSRRSCWLAQKKGRGPSRALCRSRELRRVALRLAAPVTSADRRHDQRSVVGRIGIGRTGGRRGLYPHRAFGRDGPGRHGQLERCLRTGQYHCGGAADKAGTTQRLRLLVATPSLRRYQLRQRRHRVAFDYQAGALRRCGADIAQQHAVGGIEGGARQGARAVETYRQVAAGLRLYGHAGRIGVVARLRIGSLRSHRCSQGQRPSGQRRTSLHLR